MQTCKNGTLFSPGADAKRSRYVVEIGSMPAEEPSFVSLLPHLGETTFATTPAFLPAPRDVLKEYDPSISYDGWQYIGMKVAKGCGDLDERTHCL